MNYHIKSFIRHWFSAHHSGGFGIHSPFAYHFATRVLKENYSYYCYEWIEKVRRKLKRDKTVISVTDYGTGPSCERKVCDIAAKSLKSPRQSQLLFRTALAYKSRNILELGTSLGITTMYLSQADTKANITTLEGCPQTASVAEKMFQAAGIKNVKITVGDIDKTLETTLKGYETLDLVFFDANHRKEPTLRYFEMCVKKANTKTIFIFDDIYHSPEMTEAWNTIKADSRVRVTVDIFYMGFVFFDKKLQKENYKIRF